MHPWRPKRTDGVAISSGWKHWIPNLNSYSYSWSIRFDFPCAATTKYTNCRTCSVVNVNNFTHNITIQAKIQAPPPANKTAAQRSTGQDVSPALQHFPVTHHFLVSNEKTGHTTVVFFALSIQVTLQYLMHCSTRLCVTYSVKIFSNFLSAFLNMPKNVPSYLGFHGVYDTSLYWVLIILQSMTVWTLAQHKTPIWYLASRLFLQNNHHLFCVKIQGHHFIWQVPFVTSFQPTYVLK